MNQVHVFTSAALNYMPKVQLLFESLRTLHPEWKNHLALPDELPPDAGLPDGIEAEIHSISDLDIPCWKGWAFCHTIDELATAIKPFVLQRLLQKYEAEKVVYLDPDIVVFSRLDDILEALDVANIVLTPHQTQTERTVDAIIDNEICSLKHGTYNMGFFGVAGTQTGLIFADWWSKRLYHFCRRSIPNGLWTDQRWIDLVPVFFDGVAIMRSPRHNVAPWNLTTRPLSRSEDGSFRVGDEQLGFYHFTGFDSGAHEIMATKYASANKAVGRLIDWYGKELGKLAEGPSAQPPWGFGFYSDGTPIGLAQRILYRERVDLQRAYPDPFDATGYLKWCQTEGIREWPALLDGDDTEAVLGALAGQLTPGYRAGAFEVDYRNLLQRIWQIGSDPKSGVQAVKRGWRILMNEGVKGIHRRMVS